MEGWFIAKEPDDNVSLTRLGMEKTLNLSEIRRTLVCTLA